MSASSDGPEQVSVDLPQDASAPGTARRATREALGGWRLPAVIDVVVLTVSELVTNAFVHGRPRISLTLRREPGRLSVHVHDGGPPTSMAGSTTSDAESGRGLGIARTLSDELTVEDLGGDGKVVHAIFIAPQDDRATPV